MSTPHTSSKQAQWFAIKTRQDLRAEQALTQVCDEVLYLRETVRLPGGKTRLRPVIPHVLFIKATHEDALALEAAGRRAQPGAVPMWIYRYPDSGDIQVIPQRSIDLLRLLTADDTARCSVYTPREFKVKERVRVTGGLYKGYEGYVKRVDKNKHVIVRIEGVCMVILPYIHPDLLAPLPE